MSEVNEYLVYLVFFLLIITGNINSKSNKHEYYTQCGGLINVTKGVIQTPGFPKRFPVPIQCRWVIDASSHPQKTIVIYFTQLYVNTGLKFWDYMIYEFDTGMKFGENLGHAVTPKNVTLTPWIRSYSPFLVIDFRLDQLEGNHLRFLDDRHNVYFMYGFNITFELVNRGEKVRESCSARTCSLLGNCHVSADFARYTCSCFPGFGGHDCSKGPLCDEETCYNGGTCVHTSAVSYGCKCAKGFAGSKCEFPVKLRCDGSNCNRTQCYYDGFSPPSCDCRNPEIIPQDRARYEVVLQSSRGSYLKDLPHKSKSFENHLGKQGDHVEYVQPMLLVSATGGDLKIKRGLTAENTLFGAGEAFRNERLAFHFFGPSSDLSRVKEGVGRFIERNTLNVTSGNSTVREESTLLIESVAASKASVRIGQEFSVSCIAQGSVYMSFTWLKDGMLINEHLATRSVSLHLIELSEGRYQYTLVVDKAHSLDEGIYTCHVSEWGVQQCRGVHISVVTPPEVQLVPMSATVEKGADLVVICIPLNNRPNVEKFGYTWIKNKHLLKEAPGREVWEDLYLSHYNDVINTGIILEITDIQKSATYTCQVKGSGEPSEVSIDVEVVNKSVVPLCHGETRFGVFWPTSSPGFETVADCPYRSRGFARRRCRLTDFNITRWLLPDFTECLSSEVESILDNFTRLTLGYDVTNGTFTLNRLLGEVSKKPGLLPGESERILTALSDVQRYLNRSSSHFDFSQSAQPFFDVIDFILGNEHSMITEKQVATLQNLVIQEAVIWGSLQATPHRIQVVKNSIYVEILILDGEAGSTAFPQKDKTVPSWMTDRVTIHLDAANGDKPDGEGITVVVASYRDLSQFLPDRYLSKLDDGTDLEYEINSRVVTVEIARNGNGIADRATGNVWVDVELDVPNVLKDPNPELWNWTCGIADFASFRSNWDLNSCTGRFLPGNATKCRCRKTGTYAVLLISGSNAMESKPSESDHLVVIIGCGSCLIQSLLTLCLLLPYWCRHKTCLAFLKMQCCLAVSGAMSIFIYSVQYSVPKSVFPYTTTFLEIFLLVGLSSHLSKVLIVYTEIIQVPRVRHIKETIVCIITGAPVLAVLCNLLGYHTTGWILKSWWIVKDSMIFNVFIACALVLVFLFSFLYVIVIRKLHHLTKMNTSKSKAIFRRLSLLKRGGVIFFAMTLMESASIFYINVLNVYSQFFFCCTSVLLGLIILICYIVKSEASYHAKMWWNFKMDPALTDDDFSSESVINPLNFFTKQDGDAESEAAAPRRAAEAGTRGSKGPRTSAGAADASEQLLMADAKATINGDCGAVTQETYMYNANGSADEKAAEGSHSTPSKYKSASSFKYGDALFANYGEPEIPAEESWSYEKGNGGLPKCEAAQCCGKEPSVSSQEIITTRVCVELGVITTHQRNEMTGQDVATPAIVLCSVDVEPCQSRVLEVSDVLTDSICYNGISNAGSFVLGVAGQEAEGIVNSKPAKDHVSEGGKAEDGAGERAEGSADAEDAGKPETAEVKEPAEAEDHMDGMLDRISHDLDYLLNRKANRKAGKSPNSAAHDVSEGSEDSKNQFLCKC